MKICSLEVDSGRFFHDDQINNIGWDKNLHIIFVQRDFRRRESQKLGSQQVEQSSSADAAGSDTQKQGLTARGARRRARER